MSVLCWTKLVSLFVCALKFDTNTMGIEGVKERSQWVYSGLCCNNDSDKENDDDGHKQSA